MKCRIRVFENCIALFYGSLHSHHNYIHFSSDLYFFVIYIYICFSGDGEGGVTGDSELKYRGLATSLLCFAARI